MAQAFSACSRHAWASKRGAHTAARPAIGRRFGQDPARPQPALAPTRLASSLKDAASGVEFPLVQKFWEGEEFRCLGAGTRFKRFLVLNVKVYSAALYVEGDKCAKELGIRARGGFFETDDDYCQAILDGAFHKVLVIHLVRDIEAAQFSEAINEALAPRMQFAGETEILSKFVEYFTERKLNTNTEISIFWNVVGDLETVIVEGAVDTPDYAKLTPGLRLRSQTMCRGLFEVFLGSNSVVPDAKAVWVGGAKNLLEYDQVKRDTRKSGSG